MYKIRSNLSKSKNTRYGRTKGSKNKKSKANQEPLLNEENIDVDDDSLVKRFQNLCLKEIIQEYMKVQQ